MSVERRKGDTAAKVERRVLAGQEPRVEIRVDTESMGEGDWARPSKGQRGISPSRAEPQSTHFLPARIFSSVCGILRGKGTS